MHTVRLPALALLGSALLWTGCRKDTPVKPAPDPCVGTKANPLSFRFLENYGTPTPDTAFTKKLFELAEFKHPSDVRQANPSVGVVQTPVVFF